MDRHINNQNKIFLSSVSIRKYIEIVMFKQYLNADLVQLQFYCMHEQAVSTTSFGWKKNYVLIIARFCYFFQKSFAPSAGSVMLNINDILQCLLYQIQKDIFQSDC